MNLVAWFATTTEVCVRLQQNVQKPTAHPHNVHINRRWKQLFPPTTHSYCFELPIDFAISIVIYYSLYIYFYRNKFCDPQNPKHSHTIKYTLAKSARARKRATNRRRHFHMVFLTFFFCSSHLICCLSDSGVQFSVRAAKTLLFRFSSHSMRIDLFRCNFFSRISISYEFLF